MDNGSVTKYQQFVFFLVYVVVKCCKKTCSGTMWSGDTQYSQWALNPSAYQNVSHEEVDWAALAQQWIQMKETCPVDQVPPAPPPPVIGDTSAPKKGAGSEAGEAPMDMELKDDPDSSNASNSNSQDAASWNNWSSWQQWGWNWGGGMPPGAAAPPPPPPAMMPSKGAGMQPYQYPPGPQQYGPAPGVYDYNHTPGSNHYNQMLPGGYWGGAPPGAVDGPPGAPVAPVMMGPAPFIRQNRPEWRRGGIGRPQDRTKLPPKSDDEEDTTTMIDAAKRRQLPAWIREGLEKMEREKQKKLDLERQLRERETLRQRRLQEEEEALSGLAPGLPKKSKFDSDSEDEPEQEAAAVQPREARSPSPSQLSGRRRSRFSDAASPEASPRPAVEREPSPPPGPVRSQEEILQEQMLLVRRSLTEILLEVTTEQLEEVAHQVLHKFRAKAPALQLRKTQALASLTGKLGLGIYGDSEEESEDSDDEPGSRRDNAVDSDQELKDQILRRKQEFSKIERDIETHLAQEEERERQELRSRAAATAAQEEESDDERVKRGETQAQ
ncbi:arginine/serine-rich protein PNISR isoform X5 [Bacillus rossius redtenbacheri]|uniref:arginine/serine-rich protein PNISR isoform X5 n=1 Tax=Bacillus rossius redtenbacheri TaxID=93214 RepID=UPI002FDE682C